MLLLHQTREVDLPYLFEFMLKSKIVKNVNLPKLKHANQFELHIILFQNNVKNREICVSNKQHLGKFSYFEVFEQNSSFPDM